MKQNKYIHSEITHNLESPNEIVPFLIDLLNPKSVVDVGCGIGTFLYSFKQNNVKNVLGIDGSWADKSLISKYLDENEFVEKDLEKPFEINQKFDLAICVEVAEHLSEASADGFVENLIKLSDILVFSAAIPFQGGQNHINEQWTEYWIEKFSKHGYEFHDVLRPVFWENQKIFSWYRQNIFLVTKKDFTFPIEMLEKLNKNKKIMHLVHPEIFVQKSIQLEEYTKIIKGKYGLKNYLKLILNKFGLK